MTTSDKEVANNTDARQFEIREGDLVARLTYRMLKDGVVELIHTEVPKELEGQGFATRLAAAALEYASKESLRVVPTCPVVRKYMMRHPEFSKLAYRTDD